MTSNTPLIKPKKKKDLFSIEKKYRFRIFQLASIQRSLGIEILKYWEISIQIEQKRLETIQKVFIEYINLYQQTYGINSQLEQTIKQFKQFNIEQDILLHFSLEKVISSENTLQIKKSINQKEIFSINDIKIYVNQLYCEDITFNLHGLV